MGDHRHLRSFPTRRSSDLRMPPEAITKEWEVEGLPDAPSRLEISTSATINLLKQGLGGDPRDLGLQLFDYRWQQVRRSEEHTSELQSQSNLVCRLLLEKKN